MPEASASPTNIELFKVEDHLIGVYQARKAAGHDTSEVIEAYGIVSKELAERGLISKGLPAEESHPGKNDPEADDGDNDDQPGALNNTGAGVGPSEARGGTEQQTPRPKPKTTNGPYAGPTKHSHPGDANVDRPTAGVRKEDGPPVAGKHPSMDDGIHTRRGLKHGKGGEAHRFLEAVDEDNDLDDGPDPDNTHHDNSIPGGHASQNKSPEGSNRTHARTGGVIKGYEGQDIYLGDIFFKAWDAEQRRQAAKSGEALPDGSFPIKSASDLSDAVHLFKTGHQGSDPSRTKAHIRSRARALGHSDPFAKAMAPSAQQREQKRQDLDDDAKAVDPKASTGADEDGYVDSSLSHGVDEDIYTPHPFEPADIPSICLVCGRPIADHVGKFVGSDDSWEYAAYVIKEFTRELVEKGVTDPNATILLKRDFSAEERRTFAQNGVALPDGSFPIPDEASLHNAIRLVGHAHNPQAAMHHIIERAKAMGMTHALPPAWNVKDAGDHDEDAGPKPGAHSMAPGETNEARPNARSSHMKSLAGAFKKGLDAGLDAQTVLEVVNAATANEFEQYAVLKAAENRYTLGPVYMPDQYDAHGEWTTAEELQKALWGYVRETGADRRVYLQHTDRPAGEWLEVMQWPHPVHATMQKSINGVRKATSVEFPAGTVYMGVQWEPWAWEMVKAEQITGFSMGGWARRLEAQIDHLAA